MAPQQLRRLTTLALWGVVLLCCVIAAEGKRKKKKKQTALQTKEASMGSFISLVAMRMLFGLASWVGLGEWAGGLFGGALAPPGSDYDYADYGAGLDFDF